MNTLENPLVTAVRNLLGANQLLIQIDFPDGPKPVIPRAVYEKQGQLIIEFPSSAIGVPPFAPDEPGGLR